MKRSASLLGMLALLLVLAPFAAAQETRGSIEGVVKDSSGAVLPGVTVEARSAGGAITSGVSDAAGVYRFPSLTPGAYEVAANLTGFQSAKVENVQLQLGQVLKINFALQIAGLTEAVQVTAESPLIDVKQNAASMSIQRDVIDLIPKGRDFTSLITTAPGTNNESRGGGINIDGSSGSENRFIVDGLDATNLRNGTSTGTSSNGILSDFIQEVQVKSSGYNAEFRAATGGVVSAISRSGTNQYHGEIGAYYTDNIRMRGYIRQGSRLDPLNPLIAQYTTGVRDPGYTLEPVGTLGGPILRSRLWFFAGYVPQLPRSERTVTFTQNRAAGPQTFSNSSKDHNINYNVTAQLTSKLRTKFSISHEPIVGAVGLPGLEPDYISNAPFVRGDRVPDLNYRTSTANPATFPGVLYTNNFNNAYRSVTDWVVSPKLFLNLAAGYWAYGSRGQTLTDFNTSTRRTFNQSNNVFPEVPASLVQPSGYADGIVNTRAVKDDYMRWSLNGDATYYGNWKGQHNIKTGFQYERLGNDILTGQQAPNISLSWNQTRTTLDLPARLVRGTYGFYTVSRAYTEGAVRTNNYGIFLQDAWTLNNKLTLNLGLRSESEHVPSYRPENSGIDFSFKDKLAPRVGFAYDIKGDGKWKGYGSWGMFYDISKLEMPLGSFGAQRWISYYYTLDTFNWPSINCEGPQGSGCPGTYIDQVDFRHVSNGQGVDDLVEPDMKPIRAQEFTLGADHELNRTMSVGVRYAHKWMDRTIEDVGIAVPGVGEVFYISNPGRGISENLLRDKAGCTTCPSQPIPKRTYDGVEVRLIKRYANNWYLNTSYLRSRLYGNYSGLSSSDENGRNSPSVLRYFDGQYMSFDQTGAPVYGPLGTDRPHQFKLQASYSLPWGTQAGVFYQLASGLPQQQQITILGVPVFNLGRNSMGRSPTFSQTDLTLSHRLKLMAGTDVTVEANVINLFDQDIVTGYTNTPYRDAIPLSSAQQFFNGFDADAIAAATPSVRKNPLFRMPSGFQAARVVRFAAKFRF